MGERVRLLSSKDPTKKGVAGKVVLETANTLRIEARRGILTVEKHGSVFELVRSGEVVSGSDIAGRLEDRLGGRPR